MKQNKLIEIIQDLISFLIYDLNWVWLEFILKSLCELEMQIKLIFDEEFRHYVDCADTVFVSAGQKESYADENIPKETFYCEDCMYKGRSKLAKFFFGYQSCGYCYYLGKGDFSFSKATTLLWDGCKECGRFEDIPEEHLAGIEDTDSVYYMSEDEMWDKYKEMKDEENTNS